MELDILRGGHTRYLYAMLLYRLLLLLCLSVLTTFVLRFTTCNDPCNDYLYESLVYLFFQAHSICASRLRPVPMILSIFFEFQHVVIESDTTWRYPSSYCCDVTRLSRVHAVPHASCCFQLHLLDLAPIHLYLSSFAHTSQHLLNTDIETQKFVLNPYRLSFRMSIVTIRVSSNLSCLHFFCLLLEPLSSYAGSWFGLKKLTYIPCCWFHRMLSSSTILRVSSTHITSA